MRGVQEVGGSRGAPQLERPRRARAGIHEHHSLSPFEIERVLDLQLELGDHFDARKRRRLEPRGELGPERVVTAARIADGEHQHRRPSAHFELRTSVSTTVPAASTSCTSSGILPIACVAHERHGSNARTATSMWFRSPSVIFCPSRYLRATSRMAMFIAWLLWVVETIRLARATWSFSSTR